MQNNEFSLKPKTFFVREFHTGRNVPKPLLHLTQLERLSDVAERVVGGEPDSEGTPPFEQPEKKQQPEVRPESRDSMKTMSDYQQRLYATKAALKAALENGDRDLSILDYLKKKPSKPAPSDGDGGDGHRGHDHDEQTKEDKDGRVRGHKESDLNKGVLFDEQIKEDLSKIGIYDPR